MNYAHAFDIAAAAIQRREPIFGNKYPEGAARDVALAIVDLASDDPKVILDLAVAKMEAIEAEISAYNEAAY